MFRISWFLLLNPTHDAVTEKPTTNKIFWAEEFLMNIQQVERPLEQYVKEFLSIFHQ
ncbi:hypothetical protein M9458_025796, partial [Cirrhinus mrigala]